MIGSLIDFSNSTKILLFDSSFTQTEMNRIVKLLEHAAGRVIESIAHANTAQ